MNVHLLLWEWSNLEGRKNELIECSWTIKSGDLSVWKSPLLVLLGSSWQMTEKGPDYSSRKSHPQNNQAMFSLCSQLYLAQLLILNTLWFSCCSTHFPPKRDQVSSHLPLHAPARTTHCPVHTLPAHSIFCDTSGSHYTPLWGHQTQT